MNETERESVGEEAGIFMRRTRHHGGGRRAIASIDSTGFDALRVLRDEVAAQGVEVWTINPSSRKTALVDEEAAVLGVTIPKRFQTYDDALRAYQALGPSASQPSTGHED